MVKAIGWLGGALLRLGVALVILLAVYQAAGLVLMPLADSRKDAVQERLGALLDIPVRIDSVEGGWSRFSPRVTLRGLEFLFPARQGPGLFDSHLAGNMSIQLDVPASLLRREWVVERVFLESLSLDLEEKAPGRWTLAGFDPGSGDLLESLVETLLNTGDLRLGDADIVLHPLDGPAVALEDGSLRLRNRDGHHQLELIAALEGQQRPLQLVLEMEGDPRGEFRAEAYLDLAGADASPLLGLLPERPARLDRLAGKARLWLAFDQHGPREAHGQLEGLDLAGHSSSALPVRLNQATGSFSARQDSPGDWRLWTQDLSFHWEEQDWQPADLFLSVNKEGQESTVDLVAERIDMGITSDMLLLSGVLPPGAGQILDTLAPAGHLTNIRLSSTFSGGGARGFQLRANVEDASVRAWQGAPSGSGISGYVEASEAGGLFELDARDFRLHLPRLFDRPWHYESINSRVHWAVADGAVRIGSSLIDARNSNLHARVQFDLHTAPTAGGGWGSQLSVLVGALEMDAAAKSGYLPRLPAIAPTMDWLEGALLGGQLENSGFIFRGEVGRSPPPGSATVQSFYDFRDLSLDYQPGWPVLEKASGRVLHRDLEADISAREGEIAGIALRPTTARLRRHPGGKGSLLEVSGGAATSAGLGLDFLRDSPVREGIGGFLDDWRAEGGIQVDLALAVPINVPGERPDVRVDVVSEGSELRIPAHSLRIGEIRGRARYTSAEGLNASGLSGSLFGAPVAAGIESFDRESADGSGHERGTRIFGTGRASREALADWPGQPAFARRLLGHTEGEIEYRADLRLYQDAGAGAPATRLTLESDLLGLAIGLPEPFAKAGDDIRPLRLQVDFSDRGQTLTSHYGDTFYGRMSMDGEGIRRGLINFGPQNQEFRVRQSDSNAPGLLVTGSLDAFDFEAWREVVRGFGGDADGGDGIGASLRLVDVNIGRLALGAQVLRDINVQVQRTPASWDVFLHNPLLRGHVEFPDDGARPRRVRLDYLRLPAGDEEPREPAAKAPDQPRPDMLAGLDPAALPPLDFRTGEFSLGENNLGAWEFHLQPRDWGAEVSGLKVTMADAQIGALEGEAGARLEWRREGEGHRSSFTGLFRAGDLARVLPALGYGANVESESASLAGELNWPGSPAAFSFVHSSGAVDMDIRKGRFVDIDSGTSRLFGAFSFDSIVRRLQLDFSDLYQRGFAFDSIHGGLDFDDGIVATRSEVVIQGPSSRIAIDGRLDLPAQSIQADMLVYVPLSQNISVLAGILGAWPLAVSTYVAGRIFEEQMEDFTSVLYRLEGPWNNLQAGFEPPEGSEPAAPPGSE